MLKGGILIKRELKDTPMITEKNLNWNDLKQILDNSYDEIFVVDTNGITIYVNEGSVRNYGVSPNELIGKPVNYVEERGYCTPVLAPVFLNLKERITLQQSTVLGKVLTVTSTPVFKENGDLKFVVLNSRDITNLTELYKDLENSRHMVEEYLGKVKDLQKSELNFAGIIAESAEMQACLNLSRRIGAVDANVLLLGESGVGKNVLANYIHKVSDRNNGRMMHINCASIPENLLESELFGYCKGAFSGAEKKGKPGLVELANHGTLFLDEIGELPISLQAKILQLVQEHSFMAVGGTEQIEVDIRIIAATNKDIRKAIEEGTFREDLFYRLSVMEVDIPPLRKRKADIPFLVNYFLNRFNTKYRSYVTVSPEVSLIFESYPWPGNIREMEHLLERLVLVLNNKKITMQDLPKNISEHVTVDDRKQTHSTMKQSGTSYREMEINQVLDLYEKLRSSYKVAEIINISQSKATRIINKYYKNRTKIINPITDSSNCDMGKINR